MNEFIEELKELEREEDSNAFITGSQVYGTPTEESDVDLVIKMSQPECIRLLELLGSKDGISRVEEYGEGQATLRIEKLNLIICYDNPKRFSDWKEGTTKLIASAPNTREAAIEVFEDLFNDTEEIL